MPEVLFRSEPVAPWLGSPHPGGARALLLIPSRGLAPPRPAPPPPFPQEAPLFPGTPSTTAPGRAPGAQASPPPLPPRGAGPGLLPRRAAGTPRAGRPRTTALPPGAVASAPPVKAWGPAPTRRAVSPSYGLAGGVCRAVPGPPPAHCAPPWVGRSSFSPVCAGLK